MIARPLILLCFLAGCSGANRDDGSDLAGSLRDLSAVDKAAPAGATLVINEIDPNGADPLTAPDWVELKNVSAGPVSLKDYALADSSQMPATLPDVVVVPGGYVLVLCDDAPDGGGSSGIHVPFKLKGKGDEVHLELGGADADHTSWGTADVPSGKTWARLPDGTGAFAAATPTQLAANAP